ncbi:MAG TPA: hypothetical protein VNZ64_05265 [Candidatus Acidoferrum sp.]|jgi:hypothetical protein|nr:hypothetical protein [Candidatus Acidoferrum sp.]
MTGKISRLPRDIREQLNLRLDNGEIAKTLLKWLNSLPEVRELLKAQFHGEPIDHGNLAEYRKRGFRKWQIQRAALVFSSDLPTQDSTGQPLVPPHLLEQFVQWISLRLAAAAESSAIAEDPQAQLRDLRNFLADILPLRRAELISRRIRLEEQRLAIACSKNEQELEKLFWKWTQRPDIKAKLFPYRDPDKTRRDVVRLIDRQLLGINSPYTDDPEPEPACYI